MNDTRNWISFTEIDVKNSAHTLYCIPLYLGKVYCLRREPSGTQRRTGWEACTSWSWGVALRAVPACTGGAGGQLTSSIEPPHLCTFTDPSRLQLEFSDPDFNPDLRIHMDSDPDPEGQKWLAILEKVKKFHGLKRRVFFFEGLSLLL